MPIPDPRTEWADRYRLRGIKLRSRGPDSEDREADIDGGIAPSLEQYRARGHRRLDPQTYDRSCQQSPFGAVMATEIIVDHWNRERKSGARRLTATAPTAARDIGLAAPARFLAGSQA